MNAEKKCIRCGYTEQGDGYSARFIRQDLCRECAVVCACPICSWDICVERPPAGESRLIYRHSTCGHCKLVFSMGVYLEHEITLKFTEPGEPLKLDENGEVILPPDAELAEGTL